MVVDSVPEPSLPAITDSATRKSPDHVDSISEQKALKMPQSSTLEKWKKDYEWLVITERNTMICSVCVSQKDKILLKNPSSQMAFIHGTKNFKVSSLKGHESSECHDTGVSETRHEEAIAAGKSLPPKHIIHEIPDDCPIASGMKKMSKKEELGIKKLMDIAYFIALKARPFTDFKDQIELEKVHGVKFDTNSYENETACREFIKSIALYLFDKDVKVKLKRVNFIAILIDGTTDRSVTEQETL